MQVLTCAYTLHALRLMCMCVFVAIVYRGFVSPHLDDHSEVSLVSSSYLPAAQVALDAAAQSRTTVIVAHRLSTIRNANTIAVVQVGTAACAPARCRHSLLI